MVFRLTEETLWFQRYNPRMSCDIQWRHVSGWTTWQFEKEKMWEFTVHDTIGEWECTVRNVVQELGTAQYTPA